MQQMQPGAKCHTGAIAICPWQSKIPMALQVTSIYPCKVLLDNGMSKNRHQDPSMLALLEFYIWGTCNRKHEDETSNV